MSGAYLHREAFALMWYGCACGHCERIWNSRDGVTPFGTCCPTCGALSLYHIEFARDRCVPDHEPVIGQRVWIDMTREHAEFLARAAVATIKARGGDQPGLYEHLVADFYRDGKAPDLTVTGYRVDREA